MRTSCLSILLLTLFFTQGCIFRQNNNTSGENKKSVELDLKEEGDKAVVGFKVENTQGRDLYYEKMENDADIDWDEELPVFHYWRDISNDE